MNLINAEGDKVWQPNDETLRQMILEALARAEDNFIILEGDAGGKNYLQAIPMNDSADNSRCRVEYRDALSQRHFATENVSLEATIALSAQYQRGDQGFRSAVKWRDISDEFAW